MRWLALVLLAACGGRPPLSNYRPPCPQNTVTMGFEACHGDPAQVLCFDQVHDVQVTGCTVEHWPEPGVTVTAECVEACQ